jgi:DNA-binding transcriptional MocR family regulator
MKRYERFADDIAELIRSGVLGPGQRVPSVRYASQTHGSARPRCSRPTTCWNAAADPRPAALGLFRRQCPSRHPFNER